ncbi:isocitrate dehydrogenase NAD-dependent subunit 1 [Phycomyces blakesleeanus]|uniref:Isocitrate dehydrogenase [NAD] subunit 1, mitochondrial n=2 Tax=Phycomyces blakesleeanus TaxID=4837 RepID=A0A162Q278_PHYB8|nr:isocitrate dehydrogenase NAD-dependent subunit 1 [Phycomyces blakesleeanus NRRL 1555(-)]OAD76556.1 isocitrate dehydrogenase NAD-dependent subunit 1 [Phycomyces blakesleeanus NRRL 1555(-)]|eukprot:XP_018294596.1 isocitrate dehydrogenase NAD-dependent subunit 1 [Phycomyces blakesleeanus NRRL 1555(-)]
MLRTLARPLIATTPRSIITRSFASTNATLAVSPGEQAAQVRDQTKTLVTLIPGDGVGKELAESVKAVFSAANVPVEWEQFDLSGHVDLNDKLMKETLASLRRNKVGLKGILYTPVSRLGHASFNVSMRKDLDIYASTSLVRNMPGVPSRFKNIDLAIIRENTEGEYSGLEHQSIPGIVESLKIVTRTKTERIARFAFDFALKNNRKKVTCIHKANIMKLGDGLFLNTCREVAKEYSLNGIEFNDMIVDNASMQLVSRPQQFDVMVMPNLYGSILSNIGAGLVGGPGIIPGSNFGREYAVFEPGCRHVGADIGGSNIANPTAMLLSSVMMLRHLGLAEHANTISNAVYTTVQSGHSNTRDMGGKSSTTEFTKAVIAAL